MSLETYPISLKNLQIYYVIDLHYSQTNFRTIAYDFHTFDSLQLSRMSSFLAQFNTRKILLAYKSHSTCTAQLKNVMTMRINMHANTLNLSCASVLAL